jgi:outer membrane protein OmpA-like peptidoglycan-associated protein
VSGPRVRLATLRRTGAALLVLLTGACGVAFAQGGLTPARARITDEAIAADLRLMSDWQRRLAAAERTDAALPARVYTAAKAEAWLAFARDEYRDNDRGPIVDDAFGEATARIAGLERGVAVVDGATALPRAARRVRPDLWDAAARFKAHARFARVGGDVARLEVALVRAGHGATPGASCLSAPFLVLADSLAARIDSVLGAPEPVGPLVVAPPPGPPPAVPPPPRDSDRDGVPDSRDCCPNTPQGARVDTDGCEPLPAENVPLVLDGVVFETARSVLLPGSRSILDRVAASLAARPDVLIEVAGHTDARGGAAYNLALSAARAAAVRDYLAAHGVAPERVTSGGFGKERPRDDNVTAAGRARNRRVELLWRRPARAAARVACRPVAPDTFAVPLPAPLAPAREVPVGVRDTVIIEGLALRNGRLVLSARNKARLDGVAAWMRRNPNIALRLWGHADAAEGVDNVVGHSVARLEAVRAYLFARGVAGSRMIDYAVGADRPRAPSGTPEGRARNQRVEITRD